MRVGGCRRIPLSLLATLLRGLPRRVRRADRRQPRGFFIGYRTRRSFRRDARVFARRGRSRYSRGSFGGGVCACYLASRRWRCGLLGGLVARLGGGGHRLDRCSRRFLSGCRDKRCVLLNLAASSLVLWASILCADSGQPGGLLLGSAGRALGHPDQGAQCRPGTGPDR